MRNKDKVFQKVIPIFNMSLMTSVPNDFLRDINRIHNSIIFLVNQMWKYDDFANLTLKEVFPNYLYELQLLINKRNDIYLKHINNISKLTYIDGRTLSSKNDNAVFKERYRCKCGKEKGRVAYLENVICDFCDTKVEYHDPTNDSDLKIHFNFKGPHM